LAAHNRLLSPNREPEAGGANAYQNRLNPIAAWDNQSGDHSCVVHTVVIKSVFERALADCPRSERPPDRSSSSGQPRQRSSYGRVQPSVAYLQASLKVANEINNPGYRSSTLNSLGNAYISLAKVNYRRANSADQRGDSTEANRFREQAFSYDSKALKHFQNSLNLARTDDRE